MQSYNDTTTSESNNSNNNNNNSNSITATTTTTNNPIAVYSTITSLLHQQRIDKLKLSLLRSKLFKTQLEHTKYCSQQQQLSVTNNNNNCQDQPQ